MILSDTFVMKLICGVFVIQTFLLSTSVCAGCDNDCDIHIVPNSSNASVSSFLGEAYATQEELWVKLGSTFEEITIQLKIDKEFDFSGDRISEQNLTIRREHLEMAIPSANMSRWNKINVTVVLREMSWAPDTYDIVATVGGDTFVKETGLWWRINTIKTMQFLGKGGSEVSIGCRPCEPDEVDVTPVDVTTSESTVEEHNNTYITQPTDLCGPSPWIYILVAIIGLLLLILVFLLVTIRYMYIRQDLIFNKKKLGLPYLEGNYFKEENIYDELTGGGKSKKGEDENIYDEIKPGSSSSKPAPGQAFSTSENAERANASHYPESLTSLPQKPDEDFYQSTPFPSPETPDNKFPSSDYSSLTSGASSLDGRRGNLDQDATPEDSLDDVPERDRHLEDSEGESSLPQGGPRCFENSAFTK